MSLDLTTIGQVFIVCGKTDLRKGIDSLAYLIQEYYERDATSGLFFLFCGSRNDHFKALYWDGEACQCPDCGNSFKEIGVNSVSKEVHFIPARIGIIAQKTYAYTYTECNKDNDTDVIIKTRAPKQPIIFKHYY